MKMSFQITNGVFEFKAMLLGKVKRSTCIRTAVGKFPIQKKKK